MSVREIRITVIYFQPILLAIYNVERLENDFNLAAYLSATRAAIEVAIILYKSNTTLDNY